MKIGIRFSEHAWQTKKSVPPLLSVQNNVHDFFWVKLYPREKLSVTGEYNVQLYRCSNPGPADYHSDAVPIELSVHHIFLCSNEVYPESLSPLQAGWHFFLMLFHAGRCGTGATLSHQMSQSGKIIYCRTGARTRDPRIIVPILYCRHCYKSAVSRDTDAYGLFTSFAKFPFLSILLDWLPSNWYTIQHKNDLYFKTILSFGLSFSLIWLISQIRMTFQNTGFFFVKYKSFISFWLVREMIYVEK